MVRAAIDCNEYSDEELLNMKKSEAIDGLNEKQQRFAEYYVQSYNLKIACLKAGYETDNSSIGYILRKNRKVQRYILWLKARILQNTFVKAQDILNQYITIAFSDITDLVDIHRRSIDLKPADQIDGHLIKSLRSTRDGVAIELYDKMKALDFLAKYTEDMPKEWKERIDERRLALQEQEFQLKQRMYDLENNDKEDDGFMQALKESAKVIWDNCE